MTDNNGSNVEQQEAPSAAEKVVLARQALATAEMDVALEAGQARKDALDKEIAELEKRKAAPVVQPAATKEDTEESAADPAEHYELEVPADIPANQVGEDWVKVLDTFSGAAAEAGVHQGIAQQLVGAFVDADIALGGYGKNEFTRSYTPEDCANVLRRFWSADFDAQLSKVRATVKSAGPRFAEWLEETQLGNSPPVLIALSMRADMDLSQEKAGEELSKLMKSKKYLAGDKVTIARVKVLSRLAHASEVQHQSVPRTWQNVAAETAEGTTQNARQEAAALIKRNSKGVWSAEDKKAFITLTARLG